MEFIRTEIEGAFLVKPKVFGDARGWFYESWNSAEAERSGLFYDFVQDNHSFSAEKGTLRGLHFQRGAAAQAKLVRCVRGAVFDVAVDLRKNSPSYLKWISAELSAENRLQLLLPRGLAHGFLTLTDNVEFLYKTDNFYAPGSEGSIRWDDPVLGIRWPGKVRVISEKDAAAPFFDGSAVYFQEAP